MFPVLHLGPLSVRADMLILLIGIGIGWTMAETLAVRADVDPAKLDKFIPSFLIAGVIGGRIDYFINHKAAFRGNYWDLFSLNPDMMGITGAIISAVLVSAIYIQRGQYSSWKILDGLVPFILLVTVSFVVLTLANGIVLSAPTTFLCGIVVFNAVRHPIHLYALLAILLVGILVWPRRGKAQWHIIFSRSGNRFLIMLFLLSIAFLFIEGFRVPNKLIFGNIRPVQVVCFLVAISCQGYFSNFIRRFHGSDIY